MIKASPSILVICKQTFAAAHAKMKKIVWSPRNGAKKVALTRWSSKDGEIRQTASAMATSPGNMYQKQALKKRQTLYLQPSSGSLSKADRYLKSDKDIPLNTQPPPSPSTDRSPNMRKFSQITLRSDTSDDLHVDANSNATIIGTPKTTRSKHHQVRYGFLKPVVKCYEAFRAKFIEDGVMRSLKVRGVVDICTCMCNQCNL